MNKNISLINQCNSNIQNLKDQESQIKKEIEAQKEKILEAKKRIFIEEINGKNFKLRKTSRSKFYDIEFNVNIDINTLDFNGTVTVSNSNIKKNWKWYLLNIAEETECYISTKFYLVKKVEGDTYSSTETTIDGYNFIIEEIVDAYLNKKLVIF